MFPEIVHLRVERGLWAAVAQAALKKRQPHAEWARHALRSALIADGVELPPFGDSQQAAPTGEKIAA
jgi:hypothetical protein